MQFKEAEEMIIGDVEEVMDVAEDAYYTMLMGKTSTTEIEVTAIGVMKVMFFPQ